MPETPLTTDQVETLINFECPDCNGQTEPEDISGWPMRETDTWICTACEREWTVRELVSGGLRRAGLVPSVETYQFRQLAERIREVWQHDLRHPNAGLDDLCGRYVALRDAARGLAQALGVDFGGA